MKFQSLKRLIRGRDLGSPLIEPPSTLAKSDNVRHRSLSKDVGHKIGLGLRYMSL